MQCLQRGLNLQPLDLESSTQPLSHSTPQIMCVNKCMSNNTLKMQDLIPLDVVNKYICQCCLLTNFANFWTQIKTNKMSGLIWIQTNTLILFLNFLYFLNNFEKKNSKRKMHDYFAKVKQQNQHFPISSFIGFTTPLGVILKALLENFSSVENHFFSKNSFKNTIIMSSSLDPGQARHFAGA